MPTRVDLPATSVTRDGVAPATEVAGDATNGHSFNNDGRTLLVVRNADGVTPHTVTIDVAETVDAQAVTARSLAVPASASRWLGPWPTDVYGTSVHVEVDSSQLKLSTNRLSG